MDTEGLVHYYEEVARNPNQWLANFTPHFSVESVQQISERRCLAAAVKQYGAKVTATLSTLQTGYWQHAPPGCFIRDQSWDVKNSNGEADWAAHFNYCTGMNRWYEVDCSNKGGYSTVNATSISSPWRGPTEDECLKAAVSEYGTNVTATRSTLQSGYWSHAPPGCSVLGNGDWAAHFNRNIGSKNNGDFDSVSSNVTNRALDILKHDYYLAKVRETPLSLI